jgi:hypothetical protein
MPAQTRNVLDRNDRSACPVVTPEIRPEFDHSMEGWTSWKYHRVEIYVICGVASVI